ncbi:MAG: rhodanese-like domain-containing protein [Candidatus Bathyarchaeota archaeon]|nr:MAG: rhodanese-like domain-containing protein [Candidatus Bathyarchaeota archaeon]
MSSNYINITVEQAKELIDTNPSLVVLDVRTEEEFLSEHIEGAKNIPVNDLVIRLTELNPNDEILVYCRKGNRSTQTAKILVQNGFLDFYHMDGGLVAWKQAGYPTIP